MDELCVASVASSWVDNNDDDFGYATAAAENNNKGASCLLHEVTVKVLGLKSVVANLKPTIRVIVAALNNGQVSSKTALSTEFGHLHDESMSMMAVWEDKETTDSTLFFDSELKISSMGTFARQETELVVALADISRKDQETYRDFAKGRK